MRMTRESFVESLVTDAVLAHCRMRGRRLTRGRSDLVEWEVCTRILARFLRVEPDALRGELAALYPRCGDLRACSRRVNTWAHLDHCRRNPDCAS